MRTVNRVPVVYSGTVETTTSFFSPPSHRTANVEGVLSLSLLGKEMGRKAHQTFQRFMVQHCMNSDKLMMSAIRIQSYSSSGPAARHSVSNTNIECQCIMVIYFTFGQLRKSLQTDPYFMDTATSVLYAG